VTEEDAKKNVLPFGASWAQLHDSAHASVEAQKQVGWEKISGNSRIGRSGDKRKKGSREACVAGVRIQPRKHVCLSNSMFAPVRDPNTSNLTHDPSNGRPEK